TFAAWAGRDSDISFYLNSHHVDIHDTLVRPLGWTPASVVAAGATGVAEGLGCVAGTEDTISLLTEWENPQHHAGKRAHAVYTASWTAPNRAGVHSNQYFHYLASSGEIRVNQAKRGYELSCDDAESASPFWVNPFYMRY